MTDVQYVAGHEELLDEVRLLWEALNRHHWEKSPVFQARYQGRTFAGRKAELTGKARGAALRVDLARDVASGQVIGYCLSTVTSDKAGEVDSIYVEPAYRGLGVGDRLMVRALTWLDGCGVKRKVVSVAGGNEDVLPYYARYGFHPRTIILEQK